MKKVLLSFICLAVGLGAYAFEYQVSGKITFTDGSTFGADDDLESVLQQIKLEEAGALAEFVNGQTTGANFSQYFQSGTKRTKVKFIGPMNDADLAVIKNNANSKWSDFNTFDFTEVTTQVKPILAFANKLVIWPYIVEPTAADLNLQSSTLWSGQSLYAYYTDNNHYVLNMMAGYTQHGGFSTAISELAAIKGAIVNFDGLNFTYTIYENGRVDYYPGLCGNPANPSRFFELVGSLPIKSLGLWGFNISDLGKDLTGLDDATRYIIMPCNANDYTEATDFAKFKYDEHVAVVAGYVNTTGNFGKGGSMGGFNYSIASDNQKFKAYAAMSNNEPATMTLTYIHEAGTLAAGAAYLPTFMQTADKMVIAGEIAPADLIAIDHITSPMVDLSQAVLVNGTDIQEYSNTTTEFLALPNNCNKDDVDAIYANHSGNNSLKAIVAYTTQELPATDNYRAIPANTLITYTSEQGLVCDLVFMIENANTGQFASGVNNLIMSGHLNAFDICNSTAAAGTLSTTVSGTSANTITYSMALASDGHLYITSIKDKNQNVLASQDLPAGLTTLTTGALDGANLTSIDFEKAIFDQPNTNGILDNLPCPGYLNYTQKLGLVTDMNFIALGIIPAQLVLPTDASQKVIPPFFLGLTGGTNGQGKKVVEELCVPSNFEFIMDGAFNKCEVGLYHIYTTAPANAPAGFIDTEVDHGVEYDADGKPYKSTYTIASTVKYIGTAAFDTQDKNAMSDVYVLAQQAPICEPNAFNSSKLVGNNGFSLSHPINRDCYKNAGWIAVLHFPNALNDDVKKKYTDIEREYWYVDETGAVDGEGNLLRWPCHTEFMRSYNQANQGYTWTEWDQTRILIEDDGRYGQVVVSGEESFTTVNSKIQIVGADGQASGNWETVPNKATDCDEKCGFKNTVGWHQFLLAAPGYFYEVESPNYVETPWYSFCIPFDMTLDELNKYLGKPATANPNEGTAYSPDVRTLRSVERNTTSRHTNLTISKNLVKTAQDVVTYGATDNAYRKADYVSISTKKDGEDVYLKGGYPYFVKGWVPEGTDLSKYNNNLGQYVLALANFQTEDLGNVIIIDPSATEASDANIVNTKHWEATDKNFIAMPYFNHTVDAYSEVDKVFYGQRTTLPTGVEKDVPYLYNFMGNYEPQDFETNEDKAMPQYSYYMAQGKIYRYKTVKSGYLWKPYICMVGLNGEGSVYQKVISKVMTYHSAYNKVADDNKWGADEFAKEGDAANAGTFSISFDDDELPGGDVDKIININGQEVNVTVSGVYNLNGQYVGNSLNNLAKGVYVVNGKKIVVK